MLKIVAVVGVVLWLVGFLVGYAWGYDSGVERQMLDSDVEE